MTRKQVQVVIKEVEVFKTEYPDYTDEHISDYLECCDDYTKQQKDLFCRLLGY